ncbi:MAG: hypothetical protein V1933_00800 [Candidatus Omnitrophota bacterium]
MRNKNEENKVANYLKNMGLCCIRFSKEEMRQGKTPDYKVYKNKDLKFFCEVKAVNAILCGGDDPIFNKLTDDIHEAMKQFNAVNLNGNYPNVLAFINHNDDEFYNFTDLRDTITGNGITDTGKNEPIYKNFSEGRIRKEKMNIHLYIWFNLNRQRPHLFFNTINEKHLQDLCSIFSIKPDDLKKYYINA